MFQIFSFSGKRLKLNKKNTMVRMSPRKFEYIIKSLVWELLIIMTIYVACIIEKVPAMRRVYLWAGFFSCLVSFYTTVRTLYYWVEDKPLAPMTKEQKIAFLIKIQQDRQQ